MIPVPSGSRVWLATGHTDMRKGSLSLGLIVQETLKRDPVSRLLFCFRGRRHNTEKGLGLSVKQVKAFSVIYG